MYVTKYNRYTVRYTGQRIGTLIMTSTTYGYVNFCSTPVTPPYHLPGTERPYCITSERPYV